MGPRQTRRTIQGIVRDLDDTSRTVLQRCRELGFALAGIARAEPTRWEAELRAWNNTNSRPPWPDDRLRYKIAQAMKLKV